ncbi:hypothetical protein MMC30_002081 [Trapelia coarctata]|nr:hypothetical protein [Trapelia coarctata]
MLRLPASKIELGSRDLTWHIDRYQQRKDSHEKQTLAANLPARPDAHASYVNTIGPLPLSQHQPPGLWPIPRREPADNDFFSYDPVPRNSQVYWDGVMASIGIPSSDERTASAADTASEWIASLPPPRTPDSPDSDRFYTDDWRTEQSDDDTGSAQNLSETGSSQGTSSPKLSQSPEADSDDETVHLEEDHFPTAESRQRRSYFTLRFAGHDGGVDDESYNSSSSQPDLNDSADIPQERYRQASTSSESRAEAHTYQNYFLHAQHSTGEIQQDNDESEIDTQLNEGFSAVSARWSEPNEQSTTPPLPPNRVVDRFRSRSGGLPRSPLYRSHAIASSSPEKDSHVSSTRSSRSRLQSTGLLSQQPRRPNTEETRSERNSAAGPEAYQREEPVGDNYQPQRRRQSYFQPLDTRQLAELEAQMEAFELRNTALDRRNSFALDREDDYRVQADALSSPSMGRASPNHSIMSSPPDRMGFDGTSLPGSAIKRSQTSPGYDNPFLQSAAAAPSPVPLPPPFSTKRRLVSFNLGGHPLPQNPLTSPIHPSPSYPHHTTGEVETETSSPDPLASSLRSSWRTPSYTGQARSQHSSSPPQREYWDGPSPTEIAMLTPDRSAGPFRVYNDALPASSQPQTPVGLTRGGLNIMPFYERGAYTAPVGTRARLDGMGGAGMGGLGSPRRRSERRRRRTSEQENGGARETGEANGVDVGGLRDMGAWLG